MHFLIFLLFFAIHTFADPIKIPQVEYNANIIEDNKKQRANYEYSVENIEFPNSYDSLENFVDKTTFDIDDEIDYYEQIISENAEKIKNYTFPINNKEFVDGINTNTTFDYGNYDFIIVGAGAAGAVLATRLSENPQWKILLIEAGGEESDLSRIPLLVFNLQLTEYNWGYLTTPQNNSCLGMRANRCASPRGLALGGSTAINVLIYSRGNSEDYNNWSRMGNVGWSYKEVLPYFIKSENSKIGGDAKYHGFDGLLNVEYATPANPSFHSFVQAHKELNYSEVDYNGVEQLGFSQIQSNLINGKRDSTNSAFLDIARNRNNIKIVTKALVTKILIQNKTATGVEFVQNNKKFQATANKEVIISAGAINSPQLLMLSGIGPKNDLQQNGIDTIADLPVGRNLIEHPLFTGLRFTTNMSVVDDDFRKQIRQYLNGTGPLTVPGGASGIAFIPQKNDSKKLPMIEYIIGPFDGSKPLGKLFNFNDNIINNYIEKTGENELIFFLVLLHEKSRGSVTLKSKNPADFPNIDFNMFSDERGEDIQRMIEGIEHIMKLTQTKAFRSINATFVDYPICGEYEKFSNDYWECALRSLTTTIFHPCGTTRMGKSAIDSVVDTNLKVHGIEKLRVVDAGVIPTSISGHTSAPVIMIAEKISDEIKKNYL